MGTDSAETILERVETAKEAAEKIAYTEAFDQDGRWNSWNWTVVTSKMIDDEDEYFSGDLECDNISEDVLELLEDERKSEYARADDLKKTKSQRDKEAREAEQKRRDRAEYERLKTKLEG